MSSLDGLRSAYIEIEDKTILLMPEYELTDYPPINPLTQEEAAERIQGLDADITIAGFVESSAGKLFSSCIVLEERNIHIIRKNKPYTTEVDIICESVDIPPVLDLSLGKTIILICSDAILFGEEDAYLQNWNAVGVEIAILVSAWKHNFGKAVEVMNHIVDAVGIKHCYIIDRFNGLVRIT